MPKMFELLDTNAAGIAAQFMRARKSSGSTAMGMVMTLVVVATEDDAPQAMECARAASREHPARVLCVVLGDRRGGGVINAQVGVGSGWTGETAVIRLKGEVVRHAESVVLPLLLPDSPVAIWWPSDAPADPAADPLGALAQRRITDSASVTKGRTTALATQCSSYVKGNTDLAWTRITPWRALLAAALDQHQLTITAGSVTAEKVSPSADLLVAWLSDRLRVPIDRRTSEGPGITEVVLESKAGEVRISRSDGTSATFSTPNRPDRPIALKRRAVPELLMEELRRLDEDDVYAATVRAMTKQTAVKKPVKKAAKTPRKKPVKK